MFANGPGHEAFRGVYNSVDIFFKIADALGLGKEEHSHGHGHPGREMGEEL